MKIAFLYEHPDWSESLLSTFEKRGVVVEPINIAVAMFNTSLSQYQFDLLINRVNIMPSATAHPRVAFQTLHYLNWLELSGTRVINGATAHRIGSSKVLQNGVFSALHLNHPEAVAVYAASDIKNAAAEVGYPVMVKPNIGGSGAGIQKYDTPEQLDADVTARSIDLGIDGTGVVQSYVQSDGFVYRVELLGGKLFYSIRQPIQEGVFNYCAADGCAVQDDLDFCVVNGGSGIEPLEAPKYVVDDICNIAEYCDADVLGVEYFVEASSGKPCYYDINPYSNFVGNGEQLLGFSPEEKYVDFVLSEIQKIT
ncbi:MAG: hypothetical protein KTR18_09300 [Acidiferrobacterales bacterium]|nr:hypothetical protein [Acidiferrobacterales bacterium]